jgi:hypothetical protein
MQILSYTTERHSQRVSATIPISLMLEPEVSNARHDGWTIDVSLNGARVRTALVLSAGQVVGIVPLEDLGHTIPYRVVWVEQSSSGCLAGLARLGTS